MNVEGKYVSQDDVNFLHLLSANIGQREDAYLKCLFHIKAAAYLYCLAIINCLVYIAPQTKGSFSLHS